jgi:tetratricopeptide (TPR) repeat protein
MVVLLLCLATQFSQQYTQFVRSPRSNTIFVRLVRGTYDISDFADDPVVLWFYRTHVESPEADSLLMKCSLRPNFDLGAALRWEATEAHDHRAAAEKLHLAVHFDSSAVENFLSFLTLGFSYRNIDDIKTALSLPVFSSLRTQLFFATNIGILLMAVVFLSGFIYVMVKLIYYLPVLSHRIPPRIHVCAVDVSKVLILLAPILVLRNLYLAFIVYAFLLIFVLNNREMGWLRLTLFLLVLMYVLSVPLTNFITFLKERNNTYRLYEIVQYDASPDVEVATDQERALLAYGLKQQGKRRDALALYEELYAKNYRTSAVSNNLANIYFGQDKIAKAESLYSESLLHEDRGEPYFNKGLIKLRNIEYTESDRYMSEARRRGFSSIAKEPVDIKPTNQDFLDILFSEQFTRDGIVKFIYVIPFFVLLVLTFTGLHFSVPFFCSSCNRALCVSCTQDVGGETLCTDCFEKFKSTKKTETESDLRRIVSKAKERMQQIILYGINVVVPGAGLIYIGRHVSGLILVGIVMIGYVPVLFPDIFIYPAGWIALRSDALFRFLAILIAVFAYIMSFSALREYHAR